MASGGDLLIGQIMLVYQLADHLGRLSPTALVGLLNQTPQMEDTNLSIVN